MAVVVGSAREDPEAAVVPLRNLVASATGWFCDVDVDGLPTCNMLPLSVPLSVEVHFDEVISDLDAAVQRLLYQ